MIPVFTCVGKVKDENNNIVSYIIMDPNSPVDGTRPIESSVLRDKIFKKQVMIDNIKLNEFGKLTIIGYEDESEHKTEKYVGIEYKYLAKEALKKLMWYFSCAGIESKLGKSYCNDTRLTSENTLHYLVIDIVDMKMDDRLKNKYKTNKDVLKTLRTNPTSFNNKAEKEHVSSSYKLISMINRRNVNNNYVSDTNRPGIVILDTIEEAFSKLGLTNIAIALTATLRANNTTKEEKLLKDYNVYIGHIVDDKFIHLTYNKVIDSVEKIINHQLNVVEIRTYRDQDTLKVKVMDKIMFKLDSENNGPERLQISTEMLILSDLILNIFIAQKLKEYPDSIGIATYFKGADSYGRINLFENEIFNKLNKKRKNSETRKEFIDYHIRKVTEQLEAVQEARSILEKPAQVSRQNTNIIKTFLDTFK